MANTNSVLGFPPRSLIIDPDFNGVPRNSGEWERWFSSVQKWLDQSGTWTPTVVGGVSGPITSFGTWRMVGKIVYITARIDVTAPLLVYTPGVTTIFGLPFLSKNLTVNYTPGRLIYIMDTHDFSNGNHQTYVLANGSRSINFIDGPLAGSAGMAISGWYEID